MNTGSATHFGMEAASWWYGNAQIELSLGRLIGTLSSAKTMKIILFQEPLPGSWVYPCSLQDVQERLASLPPDDLEGLWAVGLAAATRKDCQANGRYRYSDKPTIRLYSYPAALTYKQPAHTKRSDIERGLAIELEFGMRIEQVGGRYICQWETGDLRWFTIEHVLLHEVGHHAYFWRRKQQGLDLRPSWRESEQSAEAYALRHTRR